jgi:hypothetical protein
MTCHVCGTNMSALQTNLPFKISQTTIIIVKDLFNKKAFKKIDKSIK